MSQKPVPIGLQSAAANLDQEARLAARVNRKLQQRQPGTGASAREKQGGSVPLKRTWEKDTDEAWRKAQSDFAYKVLLCPECEIDSPKYKVAEKEILMRGFEILQKHSNLFADTLVIYKENGDADARKLQQIDEIISVTRRPKPRSFRTQKAPVAAVADLTPRSVPQKQKRSETGDLYGMQTFFPDLNGPCSASESHVQGVRIDTIEGPNDAVSNIGGGTTVIVWDFMPPSDEDLNVPEFTERPGGPPKVIRSPSAAIGEHGTMVASACCGNQVGLAKGANLIMIGLSNELSADLTTIEEICTEVQQPVIVNMSFGMTWKSRKDDDIKSTVDQIQYYTGAMRNMKSRHPQLLFVAAAGNDSVDTCDSVGPFKFPGCTGENCPGYMYWPQWFFGPPYSTKDVPFVNVGATRVFKDAPHRRAAPYTNYGGCVHLYAHGGNFCTWDIENRRYTAVRGTSFASPLWASLAALAFSKSDNSLTADEVTEFLVDNTIPDGVSHDSKTAATSNSLFAALPEDIRQGGLRPRDTDVSVTGEGDLDAPIGGGLFGGSESSSTTTWILVGLAVILVVLVVMSVTRPKNSAAKKYVTVKESS